MSRRIDLRDGFSHAGDFTPGRKVRLYDIFNQGLLGRVGDTLVWQTPNGPAGGVVVDMGWEDRPKSTRWVDVEIAEQ